MTIRSTMPNPIRIPDTELHRRWQATRSSMREMNLDLLIFQNSSNILPGNVKWFTDINFTGMASPITVIFPREEEMTVIRRGLHPAREISVPPELRGIKKQISVPMMWTSLSYQNTYDAEWVVRELSKYKNLRIGWVGLGYIPAAFYRYLTENMPSAKFCDATEMVDRLKALKSDTEISLIKETCSLEDKLWEWVLTIVQPGETDVAIRTKIMDKCKEWGADTNIIVQAAPAGVSTRNMPPGPKTIQNGWVVTILLETSSPTGYWGELARTVCLGKVPAKLQEQFELAKEAQRVTTDLLRPGARAADFWEVNNSFLRRKGYEEEARLYTHGQGYDMVERPSLDPGEPWQIEARMFLAVHPEVKSPEAFGWICDNFLVKETGKPEWFHKTAQKIFGV